MRAPIFAILLALLCVLCTQFQLGYLILDEVAFGALLTCHLPHLSAGQLFYAGLVAMIFAGLCESEIGSRAFIGLWLLSSLTVALTVLFFEWGALQVFCGASGIGHAFAACWAAQHDNKAARILFCIGLVGKVVFEMVTGSVSYEIGLEGARPIPMAHCSGAITGFLFAHFFRDQFHKSAVSQASEETLLRTGI